MDSRQHRFLSGLVVCEFALSLVLMVGAGLLLRSFWKVLRGATRLQRENLVTAQIWLPVPNDPKNNPYPTQDKRNVFLKEVLQRLSALPGVSGVAIGGGNTPFAGLRNARGFEIQGRAASAPGEAPTAELGVTTAELFPRAWHSSDPRARISPTPTTTKERRS